MGSWLINLPTNTTIYADNIEENTIIHLWRSTKLSKKLMLNMPGTATNTTIAVNDS